MGPGLQAKKNILNFYFWLLCNLKKVRKDWYSLGTINSKSFISCYFSWYTHHKVNEKIYVWRKKKTYFLFLNALNLKHYFVLFTTPWSVKNNNGNLCNIHFFNVATILCNIHSFSFMRFSTCHHPSTVDKNKSLCAQMNFII